MVPRKDLTGKRFSMLTVLRLSEKKNAKYTFWECKCDCGNITYLDTYRLNSGFTKSCGCYRSIAALKDLAGKKLGRWTVIKRVENNKYKKPVWLCQCECGNTKEVESKTLHAGKSRSCGCIIKQDLSGEQYGWLTVISESNNTENGYRTWKCRCKCGKIIISNTNTLRMGHTTSCGCYKLYMTTKHGLHGTAEFKAWSDIKKRCLNKNTKEYLNYGNLGISVCDRWKESFIEFYLDMGKRPSKKHSIDRIDPFGNYEPENCRWTTMYVQSINKKQLHDRMYGIRKSKNRWLVSLSTEGKNRINKTFNTLEEALQERDRVLDKWHLPLVSNDVIKKSFVEKILEDYTLLLDNREPINYDIKFYKNVIWR